jgi:putative acetyltransferase
MIQKKNENLNDEILIIKLDIVIHQPEAIGLYRKLGYALRDAFGDYPADDPNSVFMEKRL